MESHARSRETSGSRRHVLVVDDEREALETVRSILLRAGYEVTCRDSIRAARHALEAQRFDLVVTDLYVGDSGLGFELTRSARKRDPEIPVILLTGRPSLGGARDAVRADVTEFVVKPVDPEEFATVCDRSITVAAMRRKARALEAQNKILAHVVPRMVEAKDPTTSGHSDRVVQYADRLAVRCGVDDEDREALRLAALLHDVGKIGIPRSILAKEGPLTADERQVIQTHPDVGYEILAPLDDIENVRDWVHQHHERWDGRGYPKGLRGDEVALPGRILILAEVYDALAEERSYKPAWPLEKISGFLREEAGRHFDPDLSHIVAEGLDREGRRFFAAGPGRLF